jgi:acyl carrier protein
MTDTQMTDTQASIKQAIDDALSTALPEVESLDWNATLTSDMGLDSVQIMNLVMEIEDNLDISVPVDILSDVSTLNELAAQLSRLKQADPS